MPAGLPGRAPARSWAPVLLWYRCERSAWRGCALAHVPQQAARKRIKRQVKVGAFNRWLVLTRTEGYLIAVGVAIGNYPAGLA